MGVSLAKGGNVSLSKEAPGLTAVLVGLGWDVRTTTGTDYDLDASALLCDESGKVLSDQHFIFYNNLTSPDGSVEHTGDNLTGEGDGDDEAVKVNLAAVPPQVTRIVFPVSIHDAESRGQSFGQVRNAFIRVVNQAGGAEIARYDLTEDASTETAMVFGELYPPRRRVEVPRGRPGLRLGPGRDRPGLRRQRLTHPPEHPSPDRQPNPPGGRRAFPDPFSVLLVGAGEGRRRVGPGVHAPRPRTPRAPQAYAPAVLAGTGSPDSAREGTGPSPPGHTCGKGPTRGSPVRRRHGTSKREACPMEISGIISAIVIGIVIGVLGRLVVPGRQRIGLLLTIAVGIVAALVGTFVAAQFGLAETKGVDWAEWGIQIVLAAIGVFALDRVAGGRGRRR